MSRSEFSAEQALERLNDSAFDAAGVDLTQIDWMLSLTPLERLSALYETAASLARLMNHGYTAVDRREEKAGRDKDMAVLPLPRATLAGKR